MPLLRTDPELLAAFRAGDRAALDTVYRTYVRGLEVYFRSLARSTGNAELLQVTMVQDLVQEAFIRAFSPASRCAYDENRDFSPYLKTIARNCFIDAVRKRKSERPPLEVLAFEAGEIAWGESHDPEVLAALEAYLGGLPAALESVYQQRFVLGRSQVVASAALGLSRRTLRTREDHLRRGLRRALQLAGLLRPEPTFGWSA
jgi:RNA polymerase sigma factor (sigma-70 family)